VRGSTARLQRFPRKNSRELITTCSAFCQEGKIFCICCSTGEMLLYFMKVIYTANLCLASFTDYYLSKNASGHRFWVKRDIVYSVYRYFNTMLRGHTNDLQYLSIVSLKTCIKCLSLELNLLQKPSVVCNCDIKSFEQLVINVN
jgi:hypothetical protein